MNWIRPFVRRPVLTTVTVLLAVVLGSYSYLNLGVALIPKVEIPVALVFTTYQGAGPEEVESLISKPIEDAVSQVEGVKEIRSYSDEGISYVVAEFTYDVQMSQATLDIANRVKAISNQLPEDAKEPVVLKYDINAEPFMTIAILSNLPAEKAYDIVEDKIQRRLTRLAGLAEAKIQGGRKREIDIFLSPAKMNQYGVGIQSINDTLEANNLNDPAGHIARGDREISLRVLAEARDPKELEDIRIILGPGKSIRLGDVARVEDTSEEVRNYASYKGRGALFIDCIASPSANIVRLADLIAAELEDIRKDLPTGFDVLITKNDADFARESVNNVLSNMLMGILLTALAIFLFLPSFSLTLIVALSMPTAVIATFIPMYGSSITMNTMSTLGLAISIGVLVNNAILVLENVYRYQQMGHLLFPLPLSDRKLLNINGHLG